jgi:TrmH family RNA methyltransferase
MTRPEPSRAEEKLLVALLRRKAREEHGLFLAEGVRVAEEALGSGGDIAFAVIAPGLRDTARGLALADRLVARHDVRFVSDAALARLAATDSPQGVLLAVRMPRAALEDVPLAARATILVLDAVQDPGNFGTLARTAVAFRASAILTLSGTVDPWNPKAVRAAAGATFRVPVVPCGIETAFDWLRAGAFRILVADTGGDDPAGLPHRDRNALVVGNEGAGVGEAVRSRADALVAVATPGPVESLNVAVAAGILLHDLTRESP